MENFNPVQNSYSALWSEYRDLQSAIPLPNVIRRILESIFYNYVVMMAKTLENVFSNVFVKRKVPHILVEKYPT
jgi:hypothetical protein